MADYISVLAHVSPDLFGIAVTGVLGRTGEVGDSAHRFAIRIVAKPFVLRWCARRSDTSTCVNGWA